MSEQSGSAPASRGAADRARTHFTRLRARAQQIAERIPLRWRVFLRRLLAVAFFAVVGWMLYRQLSDLDWPEVLRSIPRSPWFYVLFLTRYFSTPMTDALCYTAIWGTNLFRHFGAFLMKRMLNKSVSEASGDVYLLLWTVRTLGVRYREAFVAIKDVTLLSAASSNAVAVLVLGAYLAFGDLSLFDAVGPGVLSVIVGVTVLAALISVLVIRFRGKVLGIGTPVMWRILGYHGARNVGNIVLLGLQWTVGLPGSSFSDWISLLVVDLLVARAPVPGREFVFLSLALSLASTIDAPEAQVSALFLTDTALLQVGAVGSLIAGIVWRSKPHPLPTSVEAADASLAPDRPDIAMFMPSYSGGGAERVALSLARKLTEAGCRVDLVVARNQGPLRDEPLPGVHKVDLAAVTELLAAGAWVRYLRKARPCCAMSLVHTANLSSGIGALLVPEVPVIVALHNSLRRERSLQWWFRRWFGFGPERFLYRRAARILAVSQALAGEAAEVFEAPTDKVVVIPNPCDCEGPRRDIAPEHEPIFDRPVVLGVGRLIKQKDFALLIRAFARVSRSRNLHLLILGEGEQRASLEALVEELGLSGRVFLPGFVDNVQAYMRRARVFALSSAHEGFGLVLLEAMHAGTPIVSTDCPFGPREVLDDGRLGRLVPPGDEAALAAALEAELDAPDADRETGRAEREEWLARFRPEVIAARYRELFHEVMASSAEARAPQPRRQPP
jgi:glycosyltransferase involved in cell wall biosynthesis